MRKLFRSATPIEMWRFEHAFELLKLQIGLGESVDQLLTLPLPKEIRKEIEKHEIKVLDKDRLFAVIDDDELKFRPEFVREELFQQSGDMICNIVEEVMAKKQGIQTIVLVGGFAESKITQSYIRTKLQKKYPAVKLVSPTSPFRAVLKGAVLYGHDVFIYKSRISRATYGVATNRKFIDGTHKPEKKWHNSDDDLYYCKDILNVHIREGQTVNLQDKQAFHTYSPLFKNQRSLGFSLYTYKEQGSIDKNALIYTTDEGCKYNCKITVELPEGVDNKDWKVNVTMIYGGTELHVVAKCSKTGKEYPACIKF